jgi:hypothetical protein
VWQHLTRGTGETAKSEDGQYSMQPTKGAG